ncbi:MAG TPA: amidohydrolase family protein [Terriglobales bacterium]|nr:amidohydrolase family protein [Terriglobales bacterium]
MNSRRRLGLLAVAVALNVCVALAQESAAPARIAIKAGRLLDGSTNPAIENAVIIVAGDRIEAVGPAASVRIPAGIRVIDLSSDTVLPGLINGHDHPTIRAFTGIENARREGRNSLLQQLDEMAEPTQIQAARGVRDLRVDLLCGVTTEYVVGEVKFNDVYLKKLADAGVFPSPRLYLSGPWLMPTGGYDPITPTDGPWEMRRFIRKNVEAGAHHIKMVVNNGGMASGPSAGRPFANTSWSKEEMEAAVDEAHRLGVKVTVHAGDVASEKLALEAGADSIQHASSLTPEIMDLFVQKKASIVSTYAAGLQGYFTPKDFAYLDTEANSAADWIGRARALIERVRRENPRGFGNRTMQDRLQERYAQLRTARDRGIPIAVGTDNMQGLLHIDIYHLVDAGFTPIQAISAATGTGAKALGIDQEVGTLEKGKFADIISVRGRPDQNIYDLEKVNFVMVGGRNFTGLSFR